MIKGHSMMANKSEENSSSIKQLKQKIESIIEDSEDTNHFLLGSIELSNDEYSMLLIHFKRTANSIFAMPTTDKSRSDILLCVALVQIGIRHYDGEYWQHVANILDRRSLSTTKQSDLGNSFIKTLQKYSLPIHTLNKTPVTNILAHGFVSNYYINELFDFLFLFYRIDLERDLGSCSIDMLNALFSAMRINDNRSRTYLIRAQTSHAMEMDPIHSEGLIILLLEQIDNAFWYSSKSEFVNERLAYFFNSWVEESSSYQIEKRKSHDTHAASISTQKHLKPYIECRYDHDFRFYLVLPSRKVKLESFGNELSWSITGITDETDYFDCMVEATYGITMILTEEKSVLIHDKNIFNEIHIELVGEYGIISESTISSDSIRFFGEDGARLEYYDGGPAQNAIAFTTLKYMPDTDALVEAFPVRELNAYQFDLQNGDLLTLPNGRFAFVGKSQDEGLYSHDLINDVEIIVGDLVYSIYKKAPVVYFSTHPSRFVGSYISINNQRRIRLNDLNGGILTSMALPNGDLGCRLDIGELCNNEEGLFNVIIDVPNDRIIRNWIFAVIHDLSFKFEDAPYIFETKGTLHIDRGIEEIRPFSHSSEGVLLQDSLNFCIDPNNSYIHAEGKCGADILEFRYLIPCLRYRFAIDNNWSISRIGTVWHRDFKHIVEISFPANQLSIYINSESSQNDTRLNFTKNSEGYFECDLTRMLSWFNVSDNLSSIIQIIIEPDKNEPFLFMEIVTSSLLLSGHIEADYVSQMLKGYLRITGRSEYCADVYRNGIILEEKIAIENGEFHIYEEPINALYTITVFEIIDDESGFGREVVPIKNGKFETKLLSPHDLSGMKASLSRIIDKKKQDNLPLSTHYTWNLYDFTKTGEIDCYRACLVVMIKKDNRVFREYNVKLEFLDTSRITIASIEVEYSDEYNDFLYDNKKQILETEADEALTKSEQYRRYDTIFYEDYDYEIDFSNYYSGD
jgi:hypothetical protein